MPLVALDQISVAFGHLPLLGEATLQIEAGERVWVVGRNGAGKSTLLQSSAASFARRRHHVAEPGLRHRTPGSGCAALADRPVFDVVADGLGDLSDLVKAYHHAAVAGGGGTARRLASSALAACSTSSNERDGWRIEQRVEMVLVAARPAARRHRRHAVGRMAAARAAGAGAGRTAGPAAARRADQPPRSSTRSLWLETFLADYPGAVVFVTHDRAFLQSLATRIVELDRGRLTSWPGDYATFLRKKEEWLANEAERRRSSTSGWRRRKPGCGRASRRGARATKAACAR